MMSLDPQIPDVGKLESSLGDYDIFLKKGGAANA
jgi:hypothetical protein